MLIGAIIALLSFNILLLAFLIYFVLRLYNINSDIKKHNISTAEKLETIKSSEKESSNALSYINTTLSNQLSSFTSQQNRQMDDINKHLFKNLEFNEGKLERIRSNLDEKLNYMQKFSQDKLEQIRSTVENQLHTTLENKLGNSFKIVSERLEMVHKGLGEMQNLASGVGDLKKILSNVKTRGVWGETQLEAILKQMMIPTQYSANVTTKPNSRCRVEFAIKLPGTDEQNIWLPIDAKFPLEDYQKLMEARENSQDTACFAKDLKKSFKHSAKDIYEKYISPPHTTDFAIMFLPIEGLYAEALQFPGLIEYLQHKYRIVLTSPTTLSAILNSLQMGFQSLAIEKRSSEVWELLGTIKTEFHKFADTINKMKLKLEQASKVVGDAETRTRVIQRHLSNIDQIPGEDKNSLAGDEDLNTSEELIYNKTNVQ